MRDVGAISHIIIAGFVFVFLVSTLCHNFFQNQNSILNTTKSKILYSTRFECCVPAISTVPGQNLSMLAAHIIYYYYDSNNMLLLFLLLWVARVVEERDDGGKKKVESG